MALLNPIPALWECGLALPSGLCRAAAATWRPVSFCPQGKAPEGLASPQCLEAPSIPRDAWRLRGGVHIGSHRGAASVCAQGCLLHVQPTFTCGHIQACHVFANVQTCMQLAFRTPHVCAYSFHTRASPHMDTHHTCGCCRALHVCRLPMCSPLHSYVCATCICGHAFFTGVCVCMHAAFMCRLYFAGELDGI